MPRSNWKSKQQPAVQWPHREWRLLANDSVCHRNGSGSTHCACHKQDLIWLFTAFYHPASLQLHTQIWGMLYNSWSTECILGYMVGGKRRKSKITDYRNKMRPHPISVDPYSAGTLLSLTSLLPWPGADTGAHPECHHIHLPHHSRSCSAQHCTSAVPPSSPVLWSQK